MKIAIPRFGETVAPCFEYSATVAIFTVEKDRIIEQTDFALQSQRALDRVRLLRDQGVDTLICGGVQDMIEDLMKAQGIHVISWVSGQVDELLGQFLRGELRAGSARLGGNAAEETANAKGSPVTDASNQRSKPRRRRRR
jgi:predicted Fe-Mo cluster-binding NifX family protein